jgi:hypothetical protein
MHLLGTTHYLPIPIAVAGFFGHVAKVENRGSSGAGCLVWIVTSSGFLRYCYVGLSRCHIPYRLRATYVLRICLYMGRARAVGE